MAAIQSETLHSFKVVTTYLLTFFIFKKLQKIISLKCIPIIFEKFSNGSHGPLDRLDIYVYISITQRALYLVLADFSDTLWSCRQPFFSPLQSAATENCFTPVSFCSTVKLTHTYNNPLLLFGIKVEKKVMTTIVKLDRISTIQEIIYLIIYRN